jgi:hypothetical protein
MVQERLTELEHGAVARMDTRERLVHKSNVLQKLDKLVQWFKSDLQNGHKRVAIRKQHVCYGQAGKMVQERFTELEHAAEDRVDTREWLVQKANVLNKLDRLVWYKGSRATYRTRAWCRGEAW